MRRWRTTCARSSISATVPTRRSRNFPETARCPMSPPHSFCSGWRTSSAGPADIEVSVSGSPNWLCRKDFRFLVRPDPDVVAPHVPVLARGRRLRCRTCLQFPSPWRNITARSVIMYDRSGPLLPRRQHSLSSRDDKDRRSQPFDVSCGRSPATTLYQYAPEAYRNHWRRETWTRRHARSSASRGSERPEGPPVVVRPQSSQTKIAIRRRPRTRGCCGQHPQTAPHKLPGTSLLPRAALTSPSWSNPSTNPALPYDADDRLVGKFGVRQQDNGTLAMQRLSDRRRTFADDQGAAPLIQACQRRRIARRCPRNHRRIPYPFRKTLDVWTMAVAVEEKPVALVSRRRRREHAGVDKGKSQTAATSNHPAGTPLQSG